MKVFLTEVAAIITVFFLLCGAYTEPNVLMVRNRSSYRFLTINGSRLEVTLSQSDPSKTSFD